MREPANCVALAAARGMFDQVIVADALALCLIDQQAYCLKLVKARKDKRLLLNLPALLVALFLDLQMDKASHQIKQAVPPQNLFPKIGSAVAASLRVGRIARAAVAALVEWQKVCGRSRQSRGHEHGFGVGCEMHEHAPL